MLRGGYGFQVDQPITGVVTGLSSNPPLALPISVQANSFGALPGKFTGAPASVAPVVVNPNFQNANVQSWNLNLEQQIDAAWASWWAISEAKAPIWKSTVTSTSLVSELGQVNGRNPIRPFQRLTYQLGIFSLANSITERDRSSNSIYNALWTNCYPEDFAWHSAQRVLHLCRTRLMMFRGITAELRSKTATTSLSRGEL